ncbi:helix-turn-helix domain-containing protein [Microlunatus capsulatus]|uniref:Transcriptional regulator with XRE-family HTH domain n=1 Tax=Microlunatus capsulatus TaxID=99117 RepID=A0ABS4ZBL9_9ACTN|nr:helix-turn-helix transcriptional regulator [Microlunatus capsulatus]MBP2418427.1 transcriptional regulator with XRE-family HTH domain [Microlunatus capsulatus]
MSRDRAALGAFLRSRRDALTPARAGIAAFPGPRRVPGLRKEELAVLAGVSADYYSRLEQGRQAHVSRAVLDALARALRLDAVEQAHLRELADPDAGRRPAPAGRQRADPGLLRLMASLDHRPVLLLGRRAEVLAANGLFAAVVAELPAGSSFARFLLLDPLARERVTNWADFAAATVATLRREAGREPDDRRLAALVAELRADPDVDRWWSDHAVRDLAPAAKEIDHPVAGPLSFDVEVVRAPHDPDQHLVVYTARPGSATARMLPLLASWTPALPGAGA